ncbi:MAG TPA: phosphate ABC transporter ATP-binding protein [Methanocella sp.]|nr:phosphate ABC transporter ATP-binding protein [Methanocella sp.]
MSQVRVEGVTWRAGGKTILRNVSLSVEKGETLAIVGPSGAGKTSLLRIIDLLDAPDEGRVLFDGRDVRTGNRLEVQRSMAMVFQKPVPFSMSVHGNIAYGLRLRRTSRRDIDDAVRSALALLDMTGKERQYARSLSGGEAQRLAFARAYVLKPRLLLLDEPTANLDPANARIMERAIRDINERFGTTIVLVTHNVHQARRLCATSAFMMDGEIVEVGKTADLLGAPRDPRTAKFLSGDIP